MIVVVVIGLLSLFAVATLLNINPQLLAPAGYPPVRDIVSSVALTFFAFLGFGIVTFTAKDLKDPTRELPKAMYLALGIASVVYVAVSLGVFGTLTVEQVIASGGTGDRGGRGAVLGAAGYWMMSVTALFATSGATNAGLYPAQGLCEQLVETKQFPPVMARKVRRSRVRWLDLRLAHLYRARGRVRRERDRFDRKRRRATVFALVTVAHLRVAGSPARTWACWCLHSRPSRIALLSFVFNELIYKPRRWSLCS